MSSRNLENFVLYRHAPRLWSQRAGVEFALRHTRPVSPPRTMQQRQSRSRHRRWCFLGLLQRFRARGYLSTSDLAGRRGRSLAQRGGTFRPPCTTSPTRMTMTTPPQRPTRTSRRPSKTQIGADLKCNKFPRADSLTVGEFDAASTATLGTLRPRP